MSDGIITKQYGYVNRRSIRLKGYDYTKNGAYFVTICTHNRECILWDVGARHTAPQSLTEISLSNIGRIAYNCWMEMPDHFPDVIIDSFVAMPNHIHGIIIIDNDEIILRRGTACRAPTEKNVITEKFGKPVTGSIPTIIRSYKSAVTKQTNELRKIKTKPVWQRNYYERIIRDEIELNNIRKYICSNPANWDEDENNPDVFRKMREEKDAYVKKRS